MNFERYYKLSSTALILTGFLSILITGSYLVSASIGVAITLAYYFFTHQIDRWFSSSRLLFNGIAILLLAYFGYDAIFGSLDKIGNGIYFVIFLQTVKLLSPKTARDELQIFLLSFMHILAATVITSDLSFAIPFLIYIVLATWTLTMFTLKDQIEKSSAQEKRNVVLSNLYRSDHVITRSYLVFTSALSISIIFFTLFVFFSFPRLSMGNFLKRIDTRQKVSGFSDSVELGTIRNIKANKQVVFRVEVNPTDLIKVPVDQLYWRGTASDFFDGKRWKQTLDGKFSARVDLDSGILNRPENARTEGRRFSYRVFLEALDPPILFGADSLLRITWDKPMIEKIFRRSISMANDEYGGVLFVGGTSYVSDLTYSGESILPSGELLNNAPRAETKRAANSEEYLQIPDLHPKVYSLIQSIPVHNVSPIEKAQQISDYISKNYEYTLDVQDVGVENPLKFFFIDRKKGHCEYFSTALAVALRVHQIPSREVVGFRGGEINRYGGYIAVRQSDAHTWVEAYIPKKGWVRLDPTPPDSSLRLVNPYFLALNQFVDYLRLRWNKYFIEYDLRSQAKIMERAFQFLRNAFKSKDTQSISDPDQTPLRDRKISPIWLYSLGLLLLAGLIGYFVRKGFGRKAEFQPYHEMTRLLEKYGLKKQSYETFVEFRLRVEQKYGSLPSLQQFESLYIKERFDRKTPPDPPWKNLILETKHEITSRRAS